MTLKKYTYIMLVCVATIMVSSCESYLDKAQDAGLNKEEIFKSFDKFQGFIEDAYFCMSDPMVTASSSIFNFGDDILMPRASFMGSVDSDYRQWENAEMCLFYASSRYNPGGLKYNSNPYASAGDFGGGFEGSGMSRLGYWDGGWLGIRKTNLALENLSKMQIAYKGAPIEEQRDLLEGQAYMLRAYFYFHIIRVWGGMPYITRSLKADELLNFPRLSYTTCSDYIEQDLIKAAEKLPINWDETATGKISLGTNAGRLTKGAAYALLGKAMLYAGSPLMNGDSGDKGGYVYNVDYCKKAVKYLGEVLKLSTIAGGGVYDLLPWENYSDNFYAHNNIIPSSGKESVLCSPILQHARSTHIGDLFTSMGGWGLGCGPLENYVQNFGMNDGERFDPTTYNSPSINPFENRDPRFYYNIVSDHSTLMYNAAANPQTVTAELYLGGRDRGGNGKSDTGYGWKKFRDSTMYATHPTNGWSPSINRRLPNIRLADVYLMYAEAVNEAYGCDVSPADVDPQQTCTIKAWEAVKAVRDRVKRLDGTPLPFPAHQYASQLALRESIYRERAVELAFEGHRWYDLRRWYLSDSPEHMRLDALDFDKEHSFFKVRTFGKKTFEKKHYWMPIKDVYTQIYTDFWQNSGW